MNKVTEFLLKYRNIVLLVVAVILAISIVGTVFLAIKDDKINSDMVSYLSDDFDTQKGLDFLKTNFGVRGDAMVVVRGSADDEELRQSVEKIKKIDGVNKLIWAEDADTLDDIKDKLEKLDIDLSSVNKEELISAMQSSSILSGYASYIELLGIIDMNIDTAALKAYLKRPVEGTDEYDYVLMLMLGTAPSAAQSYSIMDEIKAEFSSRATAVSGTTETARVLMDDTLKDLPMFIVFAVLAAIVILLLATPSFLDPVIILVTLGVSIVINMGTNYLFPSISVISFATCAVLQLAITMDYSVFYMHTYKRNRKLLDPYEATARSVPEAASSVIASGLTTVGGFIALYCMRFGLGADIANVLIKGVVLSILTIITVQPILTLILDGGINRLTHNFSVKITDMIRKKKPDFNGIKPEDVVRPVAKFSVFARIGIIVIAAGLIAPAIIGQSKLEYSYFRMYDKPAETQEAVLAEELGNQMIMAVPLDTVKGDHKEFIEKLEQDPNGKITGVTGAFTMINLDKNTLVAMLNIFTDEDALEKMENSFGSVPELLADESVRGLLSEQGVNVSVIERNLEGIDFENFDIKEISQNLDLSAINSYFSKVNGKWYTLYTLNISGSTEDAAAMKTYEYVASVRKEYFGKDGYTIGMLTGSHDLATTTPKDFLVVTLVSAAIIFAIITVLLRNPLKSLILVILIELGIWINLSFTMLFGENLNFMVYIIISSVELGCTVDYAILLANTFEKNRKECKTGKECAVKSATEAVPAIFVSAVIIIAICLSVNIVSSNLVIEQLTGMLARGAAISFVLVAVVQTAIMSLFKTERKNVDYSSKISALQEKIDQNEQKAVEEQEKKKSAKTQNKK